MIISRATTFFSRQLTIYCIESMKHYIRTATRLRNWEIIRPTQPNHLVPEVNRVSPHTFDDFSMVTVDEVRKCVVKLSSKLCDLVNTSLQPGQMPSP